MKHMEWFNDLLRLFIYIIDFRQVFYEVIFD